MSRRVEAIEYANMRTSAAAYTQVSGDAEQVQLESVAEFESMFRFNYDRVYSLAYRLSGDRTAAEDLAQEIFVRAARGWKHFRGEAQPWTWLYRITVHVAADSLRIKRRARENVRQYAAKMLYGYRESQREDDVRADRIHYALSTLSVRQRAAIVLTVCEGLSHRGAAEILGCSETTLSWHVHRAKNKMRLILSGSNNHE